MNNSFPHMNCIVVFNKNKDSVLFCKRKKEPYAGLLNFVGGKVEADETSKDAAYRELLEETGIGRKQICLYRLMDITYYHQKFVLEMYVGKLEEDVTLRAEKNPLRWISLAENFADSDRFAGEQNIAHIINVALKYPIPEKSVVSDGQYVGIDGCKNGWIAAIMDYGHLRIERYGTILDIMREFPTADAYLIDMAIGLPESTEEEILRPDKAARKELGRYGSTVFPIPCRQAVMVDPNDPQAVVKIFGMSTKKTVGWSDTFMKRGMALFLLYLYQRDSLLSGCREMCRRVCEEIAFDTENYCKGLAGTDVNDIPKETVFMKLFRKWQERITMSEETRKVVLRDIEGWIRKRVKGIMEGNHRKYYGECASYIAAYGEVLESRGISGAKEKIMEDYRSEYSRRRAFHEELRRYGMADKRKR